MLVALLALGCGEAPPAVPAAPGADERGFTAPSAATTAANAAFGAALPLADERDFADAKQGLIESDPALRIETPGGGVFAPSAFAFVTGDAPASVNPSLWRQAKLNDLHGLFRVADGIYQVRGYDVSNVTWIRGKTGWIVVDPLTSVESATPAVALARR
jgi:alkyl sulfatase BDS1-like metallo-beta-lactamase superfamily hydrolase